MKSKQQFNCIKKWLARSAAAFAVLIYILLNFSVSATVLAADQQAKATNQEIETKYLFPLLHALQTRDMDAMYNLWIDDRKSKESDRTFKKLFDLWDGRVASSVSLLKEQRRSPDGKTPEGIIYRYKVMCETERTEVDFSVEESSQKIDSIQIHTSDEITGTLRTWKKFDASQWLITILAAAEVLFTFYTALHCIRNNTRLWGLWLLLILAVYAGVAVSTAGDLLVSVYIHTFALPKLLKYQNLGMQIYLSIPVGAGVYWLNYYRTLKRH